MNAWLLAMIISGGSACYGSPALPSWRSGMAANEWKKLTGSKVSLAETQAWRDATLLGFGPPSGLIAAWCGYSMDRANSIAYGMPGGGHSAYTGNPVWKLDLRADAPVVQQSRAPSNVSQHVTESRLYLDGSPAAAHSWWGCQFDQLRGKALRFGSLSVPGSGNGAFSNVVSFNPTTGDYDADLTYPDSSIVIALEAPTCQHPSTGDVWVWTSDDMARWNASSNTWTTITTGGPFEKSGPICVDARRNTLFYIEGRQPRGGSSPPATMDLSTNAWTNRTLNGADAAALVGNGSAMEFYQHPTDQTLDCFLVRIGVDSGGTVYRVKNLDNAAFDVDQLTTTGGGTIPTQDGSGPNPLYNRFRYVPTYKGILFCPAYDEDFWFLALEAM